MESCIRLHTWPLSRQGLEDLKTAAQCTDSIDLVSAYINDRSKQRWYTVGSVIDRQKFDPADVLTSATVVAMYLTFTAMEEAYGDSYNSLRCAVRDAIRARNRLYKKWRSTAFRNRGPKTEIENIDSVLSVFVFSIKDFVIVINARDFSVVGKEKEWVSTIRLRPDIFEGSLSKKLSKFYTASVHAAFNLSKTERIETYENLVSTLNTDETSDKLAREEALSRRSREERLQAFARIKTGINEIMNVHSRCIEDFEAGVLSDGVDNHNFPKPKVVTPITASLSGGLSVRPFVGRPRIVFPSQQS